MLEGKHGEKRGAKCKSSAPVAKAPAKTARKGEIEVADDEIETMWLRGYCSYLKFRRCACQLLDQSAIGFELAKTAQ